jgi:hypothetical protein
MRRLSPQQQDILLHVYRKVQEADQPQGPAPLVSWSVEGTRGFQASASRSLQRLERQGLLQRLHYAAGRAREAPETAQHRTTHVALTPAGLHLAQRLTAPGVRLTAPGVGGC